MLKLASKLRIGEKIGLSFGVVGLLFLLVIWRYHVTLGHALADYRVLQEVYEAKETHAGEIEVNLLIASAEANAFLSDQVPARLQVLDEALDRLLLRAERLSEVDTEGRLDGDRIAELAGVYRQRFHNIYHAWERKGLDHNSGLQGAFRDSVHELEALAGHYKVDPLYIILLQIRRGEKDLGLRRDPEYRQRVLDLLDAFAARLAVSQLAPAVGERLQNELALYREAFVVYAERVLEGADIQGGKGPFRQAAHRIEDILVAHRVPDMEAHILQLRRREKDYLLRLDPRYVEMAVQEWEGIRESVRASAIAEAEKVRLLGLLDDYRRDFLALVEQNRLIDRLQREMEEAAAEVLTLADATEAEANRATEEATARINQEAEHNVRAMGWIVLLALALGVLFAVLITRRITRPLLEMAGFLDRLALEAPVGRIPVPPDSRDEVVAMAESVNRMADHKTRMLAWWRSSLEEMETERDRWAARSRAAEGGADADASEAAAAHAWDVAAGERDRLLRTSHQEMQTEARRIEQAAGQLGPEGQEIITAAREILSRLDIILRKH